MKLQSRSTARSFDAGGGASTTWTNDATIWAEILDTSGGEDFEAAEDVASLKRTWRIRHRTGVTPQHRLVEANSTGNVWDVTATFDPTGKREELRVRSERVGI